MNPCFEQTPDLVRFRVRCTQAASSELFRLQDAAICEGLEWFSMGGGPAGEDLVFRVFFVAKDLARRVLDILAKHGVERVEQLT